MAPDEYTLMPTHMRNRFSVGELQNLELHEPFSFTKGCRVMRIRQERNPYADPADYGNLLFDLVRDPGQEKPLADEKTEARLLTEMKKLMMGNDVPEELYEIYGI